MSQNDLAFSNDTKSLSAFKILPKLTQSDHCPISIEYTTKFDTPLEFVHDCAYHAFRYDQYDVNRRLKQPFRLDRIDIPKAIEKLAVPFDLGVENNIISSEPLQPYLRLFHRMQKRKKRKDTNHWKPAELYFV